MNLYPQDLRDRLHAIIVRRRSYGVYGGPVPATYHDLVADPPAPRLGRLGKLWARHTGLTTKEAATALPAASMQTSTAQWFPIVFGIPVSYLAAFFAGHYGALPGWEAGCMAAGTSVTLWLSLTRLPRAALLGLHKKPLSASEINALLADAKSDIDRVYLQLVHDAVQQPVPAEAEAGLRDTLRALARAVDSLPLHVPPPQDTQALRQQKADVLARAEVEKDTVVAQSLERQAEALERRAQAADRSALVAHRAQTLRSEVLAQMAALHAGLSDFSTEGGAANAGLLAALSEDARRVAEEASSVAQARLELDSVLTMPADTSVIAGRASTS